MPPEDGFQGETGKTGIRLPRPGVMWGAGVGLLFFLALLRVALPWWETHRFRVEVERLGGSVQTGRAGPAWFWQWVDEQRLSDVFEFLNTDVWGVALNGAQVDDA